MASLSFADLIYPLSPERFFAEFWEQEHFSSPLLTLEQLLNLPSPEDLNSLIYSIKLSESELVSISRSSDVLPSNAYLTAESIAMTAVQDAQQAGYTISLARLEKRWPTVGELSREIERAFFHHGYLLSEHVGASLFLMPANARVAPSECEQDLFIIQLAGAGVWRVEAQANTKGAYKIDMNQGRVLYVPRGCSADFATNENHSLHLLLYVHPYTWADLIVRLAQLDPRLRELLPSVDWSDDCSSSAFINCYKHRIGCLKEVSHVSEVATDARNNLLTSLDHLPEDGFRQIQALDSIGLNTAVARRSGALSQVSRSTDSFYLRLPGSGFKGSNSMEPVFRFLAETNSFAVSELPNVLSPEAKIELVRGLVGEGLLKVITRVNDIATRSPAE